jgi:hypothetical protein
LRAATPEQGARLVTSRVSFIVISKLLFLLLLFLFFVRAFIVVSIIAIRDCPARLLGLKFGKKVCVDERYVLSNNLLSLLGYPRFKNDLKTP